MVPSFTLATPMFATTSSTPYLLVPQQKDSPASSNTVKHYSPSFPIHLSGASKSPRNVAAEGALANSQPQHHQQSSHNYQHASASSRNVLAHKHAHHLHSIPPKQKNTKSLILDHFLWLHAMARIAQAAAELGVEQGVGMPGWGVGEGRAARIGDHDLRHPTASSSSSTCASLHYNVHDDDDEYSRCVGETSAMGARARNVGQARASRARAEGLEKVMAAMIGENPSTSTSSESLLPESVRFRFALGTLLNDVFTSRPFAPSPLSTTDDDATPTESNTRTRVIPDELAMLSRASLATPTERFSNILPSLSSLPLPKMNMGGSNSSFTWSQSHTSAGDQGFSLPAIVNRPKSPATHGKDLYNAGVQTSSSRCPRHLQHSCHSTCASLASPASLLNSTTAIGSGLSRLPGGSSFRWLQKGAASSERAQAPSTLDMIPHFLRLSAFVCIQLAQEREKEEEDETMDVDEEVVDTRPHRFHHLPSASTLSLSSISTSSSAELSSQNSGTAHHSSRESLPIDVDQRPRPQTKRTLSFSLPFTRPSSVPSQPAQSQQQQQPQRPRSLKPAREWYALFAGLLTRAVLEGYLVRGWKGVQPAEVVFGIGLADNYGTSSPIKKKSKKGGLFSRRTEEEEQVNEKAGEQDMPAWSMPVDMPSLQEAMNVLFGAEDAEDQSVLTEFKAEMEKRLSEFLNISSQTSDLATHLESLLQKYPIEPVELAIMRFCESLLAWKGEPELEAYKSMGPGHATSTTPNHTAATTPAFRSRPSTYGSPPITHAPIPRPDSLIIPGVGTPVRMHTTLANSLLAEKSHLQSRDEKMGGNGINGGGGHSRSASVQSSSSMVLQTPGKRRHQPLSRHHHHQGGSPTLQPSISIASLIHPSSPTPTQAHPLATVVSSSTSTPNMTASSISSPNLSASFPESGPAAEPISALQLSVDAAGEEARRKRPIDAWFATGAVIADAEEMDGVLSVAQPTKRQGQSALERWSRFTLGSKRPRTSDDDDLEVAASESADRLEDPRPGKKALFVGSGRYNT